MKLETMIKRKARETRKDISIVRKVLMVLSYYVGVYKSSLKAC